MTKVGQMLVSSTMLFLACSGCRDTKVDDRQTAAAIAEHLMAADKLDGNEDHVIAKCYSCALEMDGAADVTSKYHEYTIHHCSQACKERFEDKADRIVKETKIPGPKSQ